MEFQYYLIATMGGLIAGSAAGWVLLSNGREAGASGMTSSSPRPDAAWQAIFMLCLVAGGAVLTWLDPAGLPAIQAAPVEFTAAAGLLVGFAARHEKANGVNPSEES